MKGSERTGDQRPVICLGILVADLVGRPVRVMPESGWLVPVDEMSLHTGGRAVNTATALARLGLPVEVIGGVRSLAETQAFMGSAKTISHESG